MRVLKFGRASIVNVEGFYRAMDIMEIPQYKQIAVVLSTSTKITNGMSIIIIKILCGQDVLSNINDTKYIFENILQGIIKIQPIALEFFKLIQMLNFSTLLKQCPKPIKTMIIYQGIKNSITIVKPLLKNREYKAVFINPVEKFLLFDYYLEYTVGVAESTRLIKDIQIPPAIYIILISGVMAGNQKSELIVLGPNGSYYSATVLALCLRADYYEIRNNICKDNSKELSKLILLKSICSQQKTEHSYFGSKVLHPRTIVPIAQFHIPCLIKISLTQNQ